MHRRTKTDLCVSVGKEKPITTLERDLLLKPRIDMQLLNTVLLLDSQTPLWYVTAISTVNDVDLPNHSLENTG